MPTSVYSTATQQKSYFPWIKLKEKRSVTATPLSGVFGIVSDPMSDAHLCWPTHISVCISPLCCVAALTDWQGEREGAVQRLASARGEDK